MALAVAIANPVVLVHLIGGAHNDALMMGLLLLGLAAFERSRKVLAVVLIALAIGVKLPAIVALGFIAWNWKGKDAEWRARLLSFPVVGAIAAGVIGALSLVVGTKLGWITALSGTGKVYSTFSVFTKVGFLFSDLLNGLGLTIDPFVVADVFRLVGLISAAVVITVLMVKSPKLGLSKSVGLALLVLILFGPVVWPWYLPVGFALLAAVGMRRFRPTMIVLIISASLLVWPTSVNPIDRLSRYQHWLGFAVLLLIAGLCVGAEALGRYAESRAARLEVGGIALDAVLVGPAEPDVDPLSVPASA
jgi:alpha-1,6-mannosyltransferase